MVATKCLSDRENSIHRRVILWRTFCEVHGFLGGTFGSCPRTSQKLPFCGNLQLSRISGQLLRSLLKNPARNFSEVAPKVRSGVHIALLALGMIHFLATCFSTFPKIRFEARRAIRIRKYVLSVLNVSSQCHMLMLFSSMFLRYFACLQLLFLCVCVSGSSFPVSRLSS